MNKFKLKAIDGREVHFTQVMPQSFGGDIRAFKGILLTGILPDTLRGTYCDPADGRDNILSADGKNVGQVLEALAAHLPGNEHNIVFALAQKSFDDPVVLWEGGR